MVGEKAKSRVNSAVSNAQKVGDMTIINAGMKQGGAYIPRALINKVEKTAKNFSDANRRMLK